MKKFQNVESKLKTETDKVSRPGTASTVYSKQKKNVIFGRSTSAFMKKENLDNKENEGSVLN